MKTYIALFLIGGMISLISTPLIVRACSQLGLMDYPQQRRKIHKTPIPRVGGIVICLGFFIALSAMFVYDNAVTRLFVDLLPKLSCVLVPAFVVFFMGLKDDLSGLRARTKLFTQVAAAIFLWLLGVRIDSLTLPGGGSLQLGYAVGFFLTVVWMVAVTNSFNLIDGMDGLAAGIAFFTSLSVLTIGLLAGRPEVPIIAAPMAGAILGFLPYNWHPARIFMGDCGSYFLGFVLAALAIMSSTKSSTIVTIAVPMGLLGIPLLDTSVTVLRRFLKGHSIFQADGDHIHHRLLDLGLSYRTVVLLLYGITVLMALFAISSMLTRSMPFSVLIPFGMGILAVIAIKHLGYAEFDEALAMTKNAIRFQRKILAKRVRMRRFVDEIDDVPTADEFFRRLERFLTDFGFESMHIDLTLTDGDVSSRLSWKWKNQTQVSQNDKEGRWQIQIPINGCDGYKGWVCLAHEMEREGTPFQVDTLLNTFGNRFIFQMSKILTMDSCALLNQVKY